MHLILNCSTGTLVKVAISTAPDGGFHRKSTSSQAKPAHIPPGMLAERHNITCRLIMRAIGAGSLGGCFVQLDIGREDRLALQNIQTPMDLSTEPSNNGSSLVLSIQLLLLLSKAPAPVYQPSSRVRNSSQLPPKLWHIHFVEVEYCEDTRPRSQLEAAPSESLSG